MASDPNISKVATNSNFTATNINDIITEIETSLMGMLARSGSTDNNNTMTGGIDMDTNVISNLGDPLSQQGAATRAFVEAAAANIDLDTATAIDILAALLTVDGAGSLLDADFVDGAHAVEAAGNSTIPIRSAAGDIASTTFTGDLTGTADLADALTSPATGNFIDVQVFESSGTWTKPANCTSVEVQVIGGGGGGGNVISATGAAAGSGGASGAYTYDHITAGLGSTETITVGTGGAGGATGGSATPGGSGLGSSFGAHLVTSVASQGSGGDGVLLVPTLYGDAGSGSAGIVTTPGSIALSGGVGGVGIINTLSVSPGLGATCPIFADTRLVQQLVWAGDGFITGLDGRLPGQGGNGACKAGPTNGNSYAGGAGADGMVIVKAYT